ncbi:MAG: hypothetical protein KGL02_08110 [Acidobacteriota bacterium]|nr:hypothetical protein [Acidobacteriota bacterium]
MPELPDVAPAPVTVQVRLNGLIVGVDESDPDPVAVQTFSVESCAAHLALAARVTLEKAKQKANAVTITSVLFPMPFLLCLKARAPNARVEGGLIQHATGPVAIRG